MHWGVQELRRIWKSLTLTKNLGMNDSISKSLAEEGKRGGSGGEGHLGSEDVIPKWWSVDCLAGWRKG